MQSKAWICDVTEHYNAFAGHTFDLLGFADLLAASPIERRCVAIQTTTNSHGSARRRKILSLEQAFYWLLSGGEIWIVLWKPRAVEYRDRSNRRRTRDEWFPTIEEISIDQFPETIVAGAIERLLRLAEKFTEELQSHETQKIIAIELPKAA